MKRLFFIFSLFISFWFVRAAHLAGIPDFFKLGLPSEKVEVNQELSLEISAMRNWKVMESYDWVYFVYVEQNWRIVWNDEVEIANWWWGEFTSDNHWKLVFGNWIKFLKKWSYTIVVSDFLDDSTVWKFNVTVYADWSWIKELTMYSQEVIDWYNWAYTHWITTQTIDHANLWWALTRQAMAKMIVTFSIDVLKKNPDYSKSCVFDDIDTGSNLATYIKQACQLWLMGQNTASFSPNWIVSRAQFWAILSRAIWWNTYEWWVPYYAKHLQKLKETWIMSKIANPEWKDEMRWYVMVMLKRAAEILK